MASVCLRGMTAAEHAAVQKLAHSRTAPAQRVQRAKIVWRASRGESATAIAASASTARPCASASAVSIRKDWKPSRTGTHPYPGRGGAHWVDFLERVEIWISHITERVYATMDNLSSNRTTDVLLFVLAHRRRDMVFQPKYAAYLNLFEPWWKILRSLALAGRRFESWDEIVDAIHRFTAY